MDREGREMEDLPGTPKNEGRYGEDRYLARQQSNVALRSPYGEENEARQGDGLDESHDHQESGLEARRQEMHGVFGFMPWKSHITHRPLSERSEITKALYREPKEVKPEAAGQSIDVWNILWVLVFGWPMMISYLLFAAMLMLCGQRMESQLAYKLAWYYLFPFGKYVVKSTLGDEGEYGEGTSLLESSRPRKNTMPNPQSPVSFAIWCFWVVISPVALIHLLVFIVCWMLVVIIPMAKVSRQGFLLLFRSPMKLDVINVYPGPGADVQMCVYQAANLYYYRYTVGGINILLLNLMPFVLLTLVLGWAPLPWKTEPVVVFFFSLLSIVPLAYYIGMAVSSISATSTLAVGAVLNASFGSLIELILYFIMVANPEFVDLCIAAVTGSFLGTLLLLPGLSMLLGGIKYRDQRFNNVSAGVGSVLLIVSIVGTFVPTFFYHAYGNFTMECLGCGEATLNETMPIEHPSHENNITGSPLECVACKFDQARKYFDYDPLYTEGARPLMYFVSATLPIMYIIGLLFTLKTHTHIYSPPKKSKHEDDDHKEGEHGEGHGGHDAPEWSRPFAMVVLVTATILFGVIAETLVKAIEPTLEALGVSKQFMGVTLLALVPATAEFVNAAQFALQNNVALSIEIGTQAAVQLTLIQIPALIFFSALWNFGSGTDAVTLIWPLPHVTSIIFAVLIVNYVSTEGRSNYFIGAALCIIYFLLIASFYFAPDIAE